MNRRQSVHVHFKKIDHASVLRATVTADNNRSDPDKDSLYWRSALAQSLHKYKQILLPASFSSESNVSKVQSAKGHMEPYREYLRQHTQHGVTSTARVVRKYTTSTNEFSANYSWHTLPCDALLQGAKTLAAMGKGWKRAAGSCQELLTPACARFLPVLLAVGGKPSAFVQHSSPG